MNKPRILIIIAYFGKLPSCFKYFCKSVFANEGVLDVLLVTDQDVKSQNNLYVHKSTLRNLRERLVKFVHENSEISFNQKNIFRATSRKICDIKVAYKFLFENEINLIRKYHENDYVGYGDLDVIFGNISSYMNGDHEEIPPLRDFEILGLHGHFTAIKFGSIIWKDILKQDWFYETLVGRNILILDEGNFRKWLLVKAGAYRDDAPCFYFNLGTMGNLGRVVKNTYDNKKDTLELEIENDFLKACRTPNALIFLDEYPLNPEARTLLETQYLPWTRNTASEGLQIAEGVVIVETVKSHTPVTLERFLDDWKVCRRGTDKWHFGSATHNFYKNKIPLISLFYKNMIGNLVTSGGKLKLGNEHAVQLNIDKLVLGEGGLYYVMEGKGIPMLYCHLGSKSTYEFEDADEGPVVTHPSCKTHMIYTNIAYAPVKYNRNLGLMYNKFMEMLPNDDDWACFLDHDAMFTTSSWHPQMNEIIDKNPSVGVFTCRTNRIAQPWQLLGNIEVFNHDISYQRSIGEHLQNTYYDDVQRVHTDEGMSGFSGVLILIKKSMWRQMGKFDEGFWVDNLLKEKLETHNIPFFIMNGVYVYHWYSADKPYGHSHGTLRRINNWCMKHNKEKNLNKIYLHK